MRSEIRAIKRSIEKHRIAFEVYEFGAARKSGQDKPFYKAETQRRWCDFFWSDHQRREPDNRLVKE